MKASPIVALDVGGTSIKAGVLVEGQLQEGSLQQYPAHSDLESEALFEHFTSIILDQMERYQQRHADEKHRYPYPSSLQWGIGLAFPGPFDYEQGISYIHGLAKFHSLYGLNVKEKLQESLERQAPLLDTGQLPILFENDARLFGLGASTRHPQEKIVCLTLGTGLGSAFIDAGKLLLSHPLVPPDGYLYRLPFADGCADDYFSRRGILRRASELQLPAEADVKELAEMARNGHVSAQKMFASFGEDLGRFLAPEIDKYQPDRIVIGGQIAGSADLFIAPLQNWLPKDTLLELPVHNSAHLPLLGIGALFEGYGES